MGRVEVALVHASAERTPFADPALTIPEAARILRPGGILAFSTAHPIHAMAWDDATDGPSRTMQRPYFTLGRFEDPLDGSVNHYVPIATLVALLLANGFAIEKLLEPQPPADRTTSYSSFAPLAWARDFPAELMIRCRLSA